LPLVPLPPLKSSVENCKLVQDELNVVLPVVELYDPLVQPKPSVPLVPPVKSDPFNVKPVAFIVPFTSKSDEDSDVPIPSVWLCL
jgi:hypothetical protein